MSDSLLKRLAKNSKSLSKIDALTFLGSGANGGVIENSFTYSDVASETDTLAANLISSGMKKGELAVLVFPPSLDFIIAFIACLKAGIVAVPVFPPHPARRDTLLMFTKIVEACGAKFALTSAAYSHLKKVSSLKEAVTNFRNKSVSWPENLSWITTDALRKKPNKNTTSLLVQSKSSDLAFLQFTSGSTSTPKGVMITHGNLADNLTKITTELEADRDTIVVSWLPQYHDMGLIGSLLGILYCGGRGFYMSPLVYLQRPSMWIEAISKYRATHLQAPNFAFKLTARKFDTSKYTAPGASISIDLSSVKHMINAAEPVTEEGITAFCDTFCPFGFDKDVIFPTFGLAEHTVFVCSGGKQRLSVDKKALEVDGIVTEVSGLVGTESSDVSRLIGCGFPAKQNVDVKIVDTETFAELGNDRVGEVWIRSGSKAAGYYEKPFETKRDFCAMIGQVEVKDDTPDSVDTSKGYLRSGDLGFLHNDELFICGRIKDLIIIGGRNYYPQDIESTAEATDAMIRPGCLAAFTVDPISGGDEEVALVLELREVPKAQVLETYCSNLVTSLRGAITQEHSLSISHIVLLQPRSIPKTTSGKITRSGCRKAYLQKSLKSIYATSFTTNRASFEIHQDNPKAVDPQNIRSLSKKEISTRLTKDIGRIVSMPTLSIPVNTPLATMMDSVSLSQFKGLLEAQYATTLSDEYLFREGSTISKLIEVVKLGYAPDDNLDGSTPAGGSPGSGAVVVGDREGCAQRVLGCPPNVFCVIM